ncbi:MAG TPA: hypothetical protein ENK19_04215, partial [Acidobacteria bacterium]|nr:hypothetical protein [Acidobacteriota bacterium]
MSCTRRTPLPWFVLLTLAAVVMGATRARAVEVIANGGFDTGLSPWYVGEGIDSSWNPIDATTNAASLHPPAGNAASGYVGPVLSQSLNVTGIGGQQLTAAVDLWALNVADPTVPLVRIEIEFLDTAGQEHRTTVLQATGQEIGQADAANPSRQQATPYTFPADAARLVEVSLVKLGFGEVMADNVSLDITNATVGPVPQITGLTPTSLAYGDTVTINGQDFGAAQGASQVLLDGRTDGLTVQSWSDTAITVQVNAPAVPGTLMVRTDTESNPYPGPDITSPYFRIVAADLPDHMRLLAGSTVRLPLGVAFMNGYTLPTGSQITWSMVDLSGASAPTHHFAPAAMSGPGGTVLTVDTTGMTPGHYEFEVRATDGATTQAGRAEVEIFTLGRVEFFDTQTNQVVTSLTVNRQGEFGQNLEPRFFDQDGNQFPDPDVMPMPMGMTVQSSDPTVVLVHQTPDDVHLYAV